MHWADLPNTTKLSLAQFYWLKFFTDVVVAVYKGRTFVRGTIMRENLIWMELGIRGSN
jgi:hypothetical protein